MPFKLKIALCEPSMEESDRYFSFKLKQDHYIEPTEYRKSRKILIISGVQGDFQAFRELLLRTGIMNEAYHWTFGNGHLVIAGNCFGEKEVGTECLWLIYALENRARVKGGYVHFILGKNEINNYNGSWQYLHPKYATNQKTVKTPYVVLYDGNSELKRWLQTKNIIEKIGNLLISHTDISVEYSGSNLTLAQLNNLARQHFTRKNHFNSEQMISKIATRCIDLTHQRLIVKKTDNITYIYTSSEEKPSDHINSENSIHALLIRNHRCYKIDPNGKQGDFHAMH